MARKERDAVLVASTIMVLLLVWTVWQFDYINQSMWQWLSGPQMAIYTLLGLLTLAATALASKILHERPMMHFSLLSYIKPLRWTANLVLVPLRLYPPLVVLYILVLTYTLPALTFLEEYFFRGRINGWWSAVLVTVIFAATHLLMGATLGVSVALIVPGGIFALVYTQMGLLEASYLHTFYDIGAIALAIVLFVKQQRAQPATDPAAAER